MELAAEALRFPSHESVLGQLAYDRLAKIPLLLPVSPVPTTISPLDRMRKTRLRLAGSLRQVEDARENGRLVEGEHSMEQPMTPD